MIWQNGNKYEGDWKDGLRDGHGVFWVKDGKKLRKLYAGNWKRGLKHGKGVYYSKSDGTYEGEWQDGMRQGQGTLFYPNGDIYVGQWIQDLPSGFGTLTRANQDVYEGEWLNGKREGAGVYYYKSKEMIYEGEWINDLPKCGVYTDAKHFLVDEKSSNSITFPQASDPITNHSSDFANSSYSDSSFETNGFNCSRLRVPMPELMLKDADRLLLESIDQIQQQRHAARQLPSIDIESIFDSRKLDELRKLFSSADISENGQISCMNLQAVLEELSLSLTQREFAQLLIDLRKNAKDTVNFSEFVRGILLAEHIIKTTQQQPSSQSNSFSTNADELSNQYSSHSTVSTNSSLSQIDEYQFDLPRSGVPSQFHSRESSNCIDYLMLGDGSHSNSGSLSTRSDIQSVDTSSSFGSSLNEHFIPSSSTGIASVSPIHCHTSPSFPNSSIPSQPGQMSTEVSKFKSEVKQIEKRLSCDCSDFYSRGEKIEEEKEEEPMMPSHER